MSLSVTLQLAGRLVLVAGGGGVAHRKAAALHDAGARLRIVAPELSDELRDLARACDAELRERPYAPADLEGAFMAVAATSDDAVNAAIVEDARQARVLCCDASDAARGDVAMNSVVRVGDVTFAVDTGAAAPAFAKRLTEELRERFGDGYGAANRTLGRMRTYVKTVLPKGERADVLRALARLPIERLANMNAVEAEHETEETIARMRAERNGETTASTSAVVCASRASALAMTQARIVAAKLARHGIATTILNVTTTGDRVQDRPIASIGAQSLFVKELELALRDGRAAYAVHSCKDLPSTLPEDMQIAAVSLREDPRDVFCSERYENFAALPPGARVGTSSRRRRAQLAAMRDDLDYIDIRGNVDTRLRKLRDGEYDAIVLAAAGLHRLEAKATHTVAFDVSEIVPAAGQGALAVETLAEASELAAHLRFAVNDEAAELAILCERAALAALRGGCQAPIGIHARFEDGVLVVDAAVASLDGATLMRERRSHRVESAGEAQLLGSAVAQALLDAGARELLALPLAGTIVVLPRTQDRPSRIAAALRTDGAEVLEMRSGEAAPAGLGERTPDLVVFASSGSVAAAEAFLQRLKRINGRPAIAAMGPASSAAALAAGFAPDVVAPEAEIGALLTAVRAHLTAKEQQSS